MLFFCGGKLGKWFYENIIFRNVFGEKNVFLFFICEINKGFIFMIVNFIDKMFIIV